MDEFDVRAPQRVVQVADVGAVVELVQHDDLMTTGKGEYEREKGKRREPRVGWELMVSAHLRQPRPAPADPAAA